LTRVKSAQAAAGGLRISPQSQACVLALMTAMALGALGTSGAQAAGERFHCAVEPCVLTPQPDEAIGTKTAHHVFVLTNSWGQSNSITCSLISGDAEFVEATAAAATLTNISYFSCTFVGQKTEVKMNGCQYVFDAEVWGFEGSNVEVQCPALAKIQFEVPGCKVEVGSQKLSGITYHNIGTQGTNTRVTISASVSNIVATMVGTQAGCGGVDPTKTPIVGTYATGNTIVKSETRTQERVDSWWS
jgi:hypothetical protein